MKARIKLGLILLLVGCLVIVGLSTVSANDNNTTGDFTELNTLIQNNNVINLDTDYNATDKTFYKGITISKGMNVTINGNGHTIDGNYQGRIFDIKAGGTLTLNNVKLINGKATYNGASYGGAIYINNGATLNINNCTFENNQAKYDGGAIYSESKWNINNCTFIKNSANKDGGAIYVDSELNINNCTFNDNYAKNQGGAIKCDNINCYNSTFIRNYAEEEGGAIFTKNREKYTSIIHNQFVNNTEGKKYGGFNVYNMGYYKIIEFNYFPNEEQNKFLKNLDIYIIKNKNYYDSHPYYNLTDYYNHGKIFENNFAELNYLIQNNNVINLTKDYKATDKIFYNGITISKGMNVTINGNGHTIDGNYQGRIFDIKTGGTLTLNNVKLINGKANYNGTVNGGAIYINNDATLNMNNCTFENNFASNNGGAIYTKPNLNINNCTFIKNYANKSGGAIYEDSESYMVNCTINNSIFIRNHAEEEGGAIYLSRNKEKSVSIIHNIFINNTSGNGRDGFNVFNNGVYKIIEFNYFPNEKQNKFLSSRIIMKVTTYYDSHPYYNLTDYYNHGKIFGNNFAELNYLIQNNNVINLTKDYKATDEAFYNGITISKGMNITINGNGHTIDANYQGRIFNIKAGGILTLNNVKLINGKANYKGTDNGGAIYINKDATLNMNNCTFENNFASEDGGAIYSESNWNINNCTFIKNHANGYGGAIYLNSELNINNCTFNDNYAKFKGGAIYCDSINCYNSAFVRNQATSEGGAIYVANEDSHNSIIHNIFINNAAGKGYGGFNVYNMGYYKIIEFNYFPNEEQNKFMEHKKFKKDTNYYDLHPYYNLTDYYNHGKIFENNFVELNYLIQNNNVINLTKDYKATDKIFYNGITISKGMNVTINGNGHTIDGNYQGRIFDIKTGGTLTLNNVKLINGKANYNGAVNGGAIYINKDATLNINNCTFENNFANNNGGVIYINKDAILNMNNCTFENNFANNNGGVIYTESNLNINNCTFIKNKAKYGGAIYVGSKLNINNCTFNDNYAKSQGGAIYCYSINCYNSTFIRNQATHEGGAIYISNKNSYNSIIHNIFINNAAGKGYGGFNVYNMGYYKIIEFNYFPNKEQNKFMEKKIFKKDTNYHDLHPYYNLTDYYNHGKIMISSNVTFKPVINDEPVIITTTTTSSVEEDTSIEENTDKVNNSSEDMDELKKQLGDLIYKKDPIIDNFIEKYNIDNIIVSSMITTSATVSHSKHTNTSNNDESIVILTGLKVGVGENISSTTSIPVELLTTNAFAKNNANEIAYVTGSVISVIPLPVIPAILPCSLMC